MKNLVIRSLSGVVYVALFVGALLAHGPYFSILAVVLGVLATIEFVRLSARIAGEEVGLTFYVINALIALSLVGGILLIGLTGFLLVALWLLALFVTTFRKKNALMILAMSALCVFYIDVPLGLLSSLSSLEVAEGANVPKVNIGILVGLIGIWINDTGAYCVGTMMGRHRLCERLSPKKSWEGFFGGMIFVVLAAVIYAYVEYKDNLATEHVLIYAAYGIVVSIFATVGDLFESMLKRRAGVKDSGNIIPGHGGVLDRIDSLLFVTYPIVFFMMVQTWLQG